MALVCRAPSLPLQDHANAHNLAHPDASSNDGQDSLRESRSWAAGETWLVQLLLCPFRSVKAEALHVLSL